MSGSSRFEKARDKLSVNPVCSTVLTVFAMCLPIAMIAMGAFYLYECPVQRYIPIYLVVMGAFSCFILLLSLMSVWTQDEEGRSPIVFKILNSIVSLFLFGWFIAGNVWVFGVYDGYSTSPLDVNYCNESVYLFAFSMIILTYVLIGIAVFCCVCCICICCAASKASVSQSQSQSQS